MIRYENDCVDCGLPCMGGSCPNRHVPHYYCDKCGYEDKLYDFDGKELCEDCIMEETLISESDAYCCDECGYDDVDLYEYEGRRLCKECLFEEIPVAED